MNPADWKRIKEAFGEALERSPQEREAYLHALHEEQPSIHAALLELLEAHAASEGPAARGQEARERPGTQIGRYKLLEEIGSGGFGTVYMAEQSEPVRRRVALKILKAGMDTRRVVARFEAERQALALMDHPNVAKILDGGETESGRPYFVMELVRGLPITEYCDRNRLTMSERLELFRRVCLAVDHAHEKSIVHRDLKPANILVGEQDGEAVPKIIDFGIAKALDHRLTEKTLFTGFHNILGTPEYMAPEQALLSNSEVDCRTDVYALGVLLYELLTSARPLALKEMLERGFDEILRTIREAQPPRPSTRLATLGERSSTTAEERGTTPELLRRAVSGDLDWITMRCLEKDRRRRYGRARELALDLERHLEDRPIEARRPSLVYRATKFARRHRSGLLSAAGFLVVVTVGGLLLLTRVRAERAHAIQARMMVEEAHQERERDRGELVELLSRMAATGGLEPEDFDAAAWADGIRSGSLHPEELGILARLLTEVEVVGRELSDSKAGPGLQVVVGSRSGLWLPGIALAYAARPVLDGRRLPTGSEVDEVYAWRGAGATLRKMVDVPSTPGAYVLAGAVHVWFVEASSDENYWQPHSGGLAREVVVYGECELEIPTFHFTVTDSLTAVVQEIDDPELARVTDERIDVRRISWLPPEESYFDGGTWEISIRFEEQVARLALDMELVDAAGRVLARGACLVDQEGRVSGSAHDTMQRADGSYLPRWCLFKLEPLVAPAAGIAPEVEGPLTVHLRSSRKVALSDPRVASYLKYETSRELSLSR